MLRAADAKAEGLLGVVRMAVAVALAGALLLALNAAGRPDFPALELQINLAATIISAYFLLGLVTAAIVRVGAYAPWMAWVTATLDVLLIGANLWLNVRTSEISSLYMFAFPAALLPALVLTFGALRFRPSIQIWVTVLMCAVLVGVMFSDYRLVAFDAEPPARLLTTFAPPPNFVRLVMTLAVGAVVAVAVWRARGLLHEVLAAGEQRANLTRFLPAGVAADMSDDAIGRLRNGRTAPLVIMFVDIRGFTALAELATPIAVAELLTTFRKIIAAAVEDEGGVVDKFIGDGALVVFGMETPPEAAAAASLAAGARLLGEVDAWNAARGRNGAPAIRVGVGVHLGDVIVGAIGDDHRLEFTVVGDPVNVAARVEQMTKALPYRLLATDAVIQAAGGVAGDWRDLGMNALRGRDAPVRLWGYL